MYGEEHTNLTMIAQKLLIDCVKRDKIEINLAFWVVRELVEVSYFLMVRHVWTGYMKNCLMFKKI